MRLPSRLFGLFGLGWASAPHQSQGVGFFVPRVKIPYRPTGGKTVDRIGELFRGILIPEPYMRPRPDRLSSYAHEDENLVRDPRGATEVRACSGLGRPD